MVVSQEVTVDRRKALLTINYYARIYLKELLDLSRKIIYILPHPQVYAMLSSRRGRRCPYLLQGPLVWATLVVWFKMGVEG